MHCAGVIREQQGALLQLGDQLRQRGLTDTILTSANRGLNDRSVCRVVGRAEQNPLNRLMSCDLFRNFGETFR